MIPRLPLHLSDVDFPVSAFRLFVVIHSWRQAAVTIRLLATEKIHSDEMQAQMAKTITDTIAEALESCADDVEDLIKESIPFKETEGN